MNRVTTALMVLTCLSASVADAAEPRAATTVRGFADLNFELTDKKGENSSFRIGEFDTYITSTLAERTTFLSEVTYKYQDGWIIGFERLWFRYSFSDQLRASIGKFHTPLGYWNRTYNHGVLLYTSTDKPLFQKMIPIHTLGIHLSGREIGPGRLYYSLMIGNGIGSSPKADNDEAKSVTVDIHSKMFDGMDLGFSGYRDHLSQGGIDESETPSIGHMMLLTEDVDLTIFVGSMVIEKHGVELLAEIALANVEGETSGLDGWSRGGYVLGSYTFGQYVPYAKLDFLKVDEADLFYDENDTKALAFGVDYRISHLAIVKLQYTYESLKDAENQNRFATQFSVGY